MKDLTKTMDITMREMAEEEEATAGPATVGADKAAAATAATASMSSAPPPPKPSVHVETADDKAAFGSSEKLPAEKLPSEKFYAEKLSSEKLAPVSPGDSTPVSSSGTSTPRPGGVPTRLAITDVSYEDAQQNAAGMTDREKELRAKEKKKGLSKEQREELAAYELERRRVREERVDTLARKLVDKLSLWTETDKGADVTHAFKEKSKLEVENLKMESFGIEILHSIGQTYTQKATSFLKSQKFLGIPGFFSRLKDKGTLAKETWNTISTAIDAQMTMEEMAKAEEKGGEDWTDEKRAEYEKRVTGKILAAAWRGSRYEIQGVLRDVCDKVLYDKNVKLDKRVERAHALMILGDIFSNVSLCFKTPCALFCYCKSRSCSLSLTLIL